MTAPLITKEPDYHHEDVGWKRLSCFTNLIRELHLSSKTNMLNHNTLCVNLNDNKLQCHFCQAKCSTPINLLYISFD